MMDEDKGHPASLMMRLHLLCIALVISISRGAPGSMLGSDTYEPSGGVMIVALVSGTTSVSNPSLDSQPISKFNTEKIN